MSDPNLSFHEQKLTYAPTVLRPIDATLPDAKAIQALGYTSLQRGGPYGKVISAVHPVSGKRVPMVDGVAPELAGEAGKTALATDLDARPVSSAGLALAATPSATASLANPTPTSLPGSSQNQAAAPATTASTPRVRFQGFAPPQTVAGDRGSANLALLSAARADASGPLAGGFGASRVVPTVNDPSHVVNMFTGGGATTYTTANGGTATVPTVQSQADPVGTGISVNGVAQASSGRPGSKTFSPEYVTDAAGAADRTAQQHATDLATLQANYPGLYQAGSADNQAFISAYQKQGGKGQPDPTAALALAKTVLGDRTQAQGASNGTAAANPSTPTTPPPPAAQTDPAAAPLSAGAQAGTAVRNAIGSAVTGTANAIGSAAKATTTNASDFLGTLFNQSTADRDKLASTYGQDTSNMGADYFNKPVPPGATSLSGNIASLFNGGATPGPDNTPSPATQAATQQSNSPLGDYYNPASAPATTPTVDRAASSASPGGTPSGGSTGPFDQQPLTLAGTATAASAPLTPAPLSTGSPAAAPGSVSSNGRFSGFASDASRTLAAAPSAGDKLAAAPSATDSLSSAPSAADRLAQAPDASTTLANAPSASGTLASLPGTQNLLGRTPSATATLASAPSAADTLARTPSATASLNGAPSASGTLSAMSGAGDQLNRMPGAGATLNAQPSAGSSLNAKPGAGDFLANLFGAGNALDKQQGADSTLADKSNAGDTLANQQSAGDKLAAAPSATDSLNAPDSGSTPSIADHAAAAGLNLSTGTHQDLPADSLFARSASAGINPFTASSGDLQKAESQQAPDAAAPAPAPAPAASGASDS